MPFISVDAEIGNVDIQYDAFRQALLKDLLCDQLCHLACMAVIGDDIGRLILRCQGKGNAWHPGDDRFHGSGDRAGIGHIVADVRVGIDPRNHQVHLVDKSKQRQGDAVGRGAVGHKAGCPVGQQGLCDADRALERLDVPGGRPVAVRGENGDICDLAHGLGKGQESRRLDAVVIGNEDMHEWISDF